MQSFPDLLLGWLAAERSEAPAFRGRPGPRCARPPATRTPGRLGEKPALCRIGDSEGGFRRRHPGQAPPAKAWRRNGNPILLSLCASAPLREAPPFSRKWKFV